VGHAVTGAEPPASDVVDILVVDDSPENLVAMQAILSDLGTRVVTAASGRDALRILLRRDFALILLDVNMPVLDGFETARLVRSRPRSEHTPIIFVTAQSDESRLAHGYALGAVDYIVTPIVPEVLRAKAGVFVELFRKTAEVRRQSEFLRKRAGQLHRLSEAALALSAARSVDGILETVAAWTLEIVEAAGVRAFAMTAPSRVHEQQAGAADPLEGGGWSWRIPLRGLEGREIGALEVSSPDGALAGEDRAVLLQLVQMTSVAIQNLAFAEERETNRLKDDFIATVSHELRTPLAAMLTWARVLRDGRADAAATARGLEVIERNARAQAKLIDDLLDMSRIMTGKMRLELATIDVAQMVTAAVDSVRPAVEERGIALHWSAPAERATVVGDGARLQQVLCNLLTNAIKFTEPGGRIEVELSGEEQADIRVRDTGVGIAPEFLPHVFDRFRQADSSSTRQHRGLGIGLAIVRQLVELHGGTVEAESGGPGTGACFHVRLPLARLADRGGDGDAAPPVAVRTTADGARPGADLSGAKVLVVEDEADACEALALLLTGAGAVVRTVGSASGAMTVLREWWPDVLVSDIGLPREDGYALLRQVRALQAEDRRRDLPAVAVTAYAQASDRVRALAAGFQAHLAKPVDAARLLELLASLRPAPDLERTSVAR
jgi:signal transduction histidine kinase